LSRARRIAARAAGVALLALAQIAQADACSGMVLHSHRGVQSKPENSVEAVRAAMGMPFAAVEVDLQMLRDGTWVLHHDPVLGRVVTHAPNGRAALVTTEALTSAQWSQATLRDRSGRATDLPAPRLDAALGAASQHASPKRQFHMEIKSRVDCGRLAGLNDQVASVLPAGTWMYSAFSMPALRCLREADQDVYLGLLIGPETESVKVAGKTLADVAKIFGGEKSPMVQRNLAALDLNTNRNLLSVFSMRGVAADLGKNGGIHIDAATYLRHLDVVKEARRVGLKVMTYSTAGDRVHRETLVRIRAAGASLPDAAIVDSTPREFCRGL